MTKNLLCCMKNSLLKIFHFATGITKNRNENKDPAECKAEFRFEKSHISLLVGVLQMPDTFTCPNSTVCNSTEGLCVILKRFSYPCRLSDMISTFGRSVAELIMISNEVTEWMYNIHGHRIPNGIISLRLLTYCKLTLKQFMTKAPPWTTVSALLRNGSSHIKTRSHSESCLQWTRACSRS